MTDAVSLYCAAVALRNFVIWFINLKQEPTKVLFYYWAILLLEHMHLNIL